MATSKPTDIHTCLVVRGLLMQPCPNKHAIVSIFAWQTLYSQPKHAAFPARNEPPTR